MLQADFAFRRRLVVHSGRATCHASRVTDFSLGDVARILKVSPRRLRYWQKTQLLDSLVSASPDEGMAFRDLVCLRTIVSLIDKGIPLRRIRRNLEMLRDRLPEMDEPAAALRLWDESSDRLVMRRDGRLEELGGQLLLEFAGDLPPTSARISSLAEAAALAASGMISGSSGSTGTRSEGTGDGQDAEQEEAVACFERGCELDAEPRSWSAAIEAYEKALELDPDFADAYCNLGAVRYNQGHREEARRAFAACLSRESDHVEANFNLANVLEEEGEDELALVHYRRALSADPLYPDLHINLALLYEKLDRESRASDHWRRYLQLDPQGPWAEVARLRLSRESG